MAVVAYDTETPLQELFRSHMRHYEIDQVQFWLPRNQQIRPSAIVNGQHGLEFAKLVPTSIANINSYRMIRSIQRSPLEFRRLRFPKIRVSKLIEDKFLFLVMEYLEGSHFENKYHPFTKNIQGGEALSISTVGVFLELLEDLSTIKLEDLPESTPKVIRRNKAQLNDNLDRIIDAWEARWLTENDANLALDILNDGFRARNFHLTMPTNCDFHFRNFLELDLQTTALIDLDEFRFSSFEAEFVVAYQWTHMWNNPAWQKICIREARNRLSLNGPLFRACLIDQALSLAGFWRNNERLFGSQLSTVTRALYEFDSVWNS